MNAVSKASAYPATVQPGVPKLAPLPSGWKREAIGKYLKDKRRPVRMADNEEYQLVTVKRARGGVVPREKLSGREIVVKSQFRISSGDFLISKRQIVHGACGLVPNELDHSLVSNEYAVLECTDELDSRFLNYLAHSTYFQQTCFHSSIGVHIEKMIFKLDKWFAWEFNLPPLPEQKKIADILSTWDKAIESTGKLLANAEAQKRALMQQLLTGKRRLPGFEGREWEITTVGAVCEIVSGPAFESAQFARSGLRLVRGSNVKRGSLDWSPSITQHWPSVAGYERYRVECGDIIIAMDGYVGRSHAFVRARPDPEMLLVQRVARLRASRIDPRFLYAYIASNRFYAHCERRKTATAIAHITLKDIREFSLSLPRKEEQAAIADVLDTLAQEIEARGIQLRNLRLEKRALMQQLLTGKRRVKL